MSSVCLYLDPSRTFRWHEWLARALKANGHTVVTEYSRHRHPLPKSFTRLANLERLIYRLGGNTALAPMNSPSSAADQREERYSIVVNLAGDAAAPSGDRVLTPYFNLMPGEIGAISAVLGKERLRIGVRDSSRPDYAWVAHPAVIDREVLLRSLDNILSCTTNLLVKAITAAADLDHAPELISALPRPGAVGRKAVLHTSHGIISKTGRYLENLAKGKPTWITAWRLAEPGQTLLDRDQARFTVLKDDGKRFYADPFPFRYRGEDFIFMEEFPYRNGRGHISVCTVSGGRTTTPRPVLEEEYHLSYPFVFEHDGEVWMIPETGEANGIYLYRADPFPYRWHRVGCLLDNIQAHDATLLQHNGRLWLFACEKMWNSSAWDMLSLFHADDLTGPWLPHAHNPVVLDPAFSRPAGGVFQYHGQPVRPSQDCSTRYGSAVVLCQIDTLTTDKFSQSKIAVIECGLNGCHTYNNHRGLEVIDTFDRTNSHEVIANVVHLSPPTILQVAAE